MFQNASLRVGQKSSLPSTASLYHMGAMHAVVRYVGYLRKVYYFHDEMMSGVLTAALAVATSCRTQDKSRSVLDSAVGVGRFGLLALWRAAQHV